MSCLTILTVPNPLLRKRAKEVEYVTDSERKLLADMAETMYMNGGCGLAATQVGVDKRICITDVGNGLVKLVNPIIVRKDGHDVLEEGCLSVPEFTIKVKRAKKVVVDYLNEYGEVSRITAEGMLARAIQHELDHLSGRLIVDYLGPIKKLFLKKKKAK